MQCTALQGSTHRQVSAAKDPSVRKFQFAEACYATFPPLPDDAFPVDPPEWKGIKVVTYAGQSPLPQLPWRSPWDAPVLLVSLFDGIGRALFAMMALGMSFAAVAVECDTRPDQ